MSDSVIATDPETLLSNINNVRNVDKETTKPRLPDKFKSKKADEVEKETPKPHKPKNPSSQPSTSINQVLLPYLRFPLLGKPQAETSRFVPDSNTLFDIVHLMDNIVRKNMYFKRQEDAWHPFISRIYFGVLFYIQTIRAESRSGYINSRKRQLLVRFTNAYPLETLPIPGPLVTYFSSITCAKPSISLCGTVTPYIPEETGPRIASDLITLDMHHVHHLMLPHIPILVAFARLITTAAANNIPDFTNPASFDHNVERILIGHQFPLNQWTPLERSVLLNPSLIHVPETNADIDQSFNRYGPRLKLPVPQANDDYRHLDNFMLMRHDLSWFASLIQIMTTYSRYFDGSTSLAECSEATSCSPLVLTEIDKLSTALADNPYRTLTHAFPGQHVFSPVVRSVSSEPELPPSLALAAQAAQLNLSVINDEIPVWNSIGNVGFTRFGPYWARAPIHRSSAKENCSLAFGSIITKKFALDKPRVPKP